MGAQERGGSDRDRSDFGAQVAALDFSREDSRRRPRIRRAAHPLPADETIKIAVYRR
jgi:hypothetical protein